MCRLQQVLQERGEAVHWFAYVEEATLIAPVFVRVEARLGTKEAQRNQCLSCWAASEGSAERGVV